MASVNSNSFAWRNTLLSSWIPNRTLFDDGVVRFKSNGLMAIIEYRGGNFPIVENENTLFLVNQLADRIGSYGRDDGWILNHSWHCYEAAGYLQPEPHLDEDGVVVQKCNGAPGYIDAVRAKRREGNMYEQSMYLAISFRPPKYTAQSFEKAIYSGVRDIADDWGKYLKWFKSNISMTADLLNQVLRVGHGWARICNAEEVLAMYSFEIDGCKVPLRYPEDVMSCTFKKLIDRRITVGAHPILDGSPYVHVRSVGIAGLPKMHQPEMMATMRRMGFPFKLSQRFCIIDFNALSAKRQAALRGVEDSSYGLWRTLQGVVMPGGRKAVGQTAAGEARAEMAKEDIKDETYSESKAGGTLTTTAVTWSEYEDEAQDKAVELEKELNALGFYAKIEGANSFQAYISSFPGVIELNTRSDLLSEKFAAYRIPTTSPWVGANRSGSVWGGPALMEFVTEGSIPFRLDTYLEGNGGHMPLFGMTGRGKSTCARVLGMQWLARWKPSHPKTRIIDLDVDSNKSASIVAALSAGGKYVSMDSGEFRLQPLRDLENQDVRRQCGHVMRLIVEVQGFTYGPHIGNAIEEAFDIIASLPKDMRTMSMMQMQASIPELRAALGDYTGDGPYARMLDGHSHAFDNSPWTTIELGSLAKDDTAQAKPVIAALLYAIDRTLDGETPVMIIIDEAKISASALGAQQFAFWLAQCRKKRALCLFSFHYLDEDMEKNGVAKAIREQCSAFMFFGSESAKGEGSREWMKKLEVTEDAADLMTQLRLGQVVFKNGERYQAIDFNLGREELAICGVNGSQKNAEAIELHKRVGNDRFYIEWLKHEGIEDAEEICWDWVYGTRAKRQWSRHGVRTDRTDAADSYGVGIAAE